MEKMKNQFQSDENLLVECFDSNQFHFATNHFAILRWEWSMIFIVPFNVNWFVTSGITEDVNSFSTSYSQWHFWVESDFRQFCREHIFKN